VSRLCALFGVTRAGFYARIKRGVSHRTEQDRFLTSRIREIFDRHRGMYGSPRVHHALKRDGLQLSRRRVERLMRAGGMRGRVVRVYRSNPRLHRIYGQSPNRLWNHRAEKPDRVWVADVTYLRAAKRWSYLAVVLDQCSRRILSWQLSRARGTELTRRAFDAAFQDRQPDRLIFHSDRGVEYAAPGFRDRLTALGVRQSMTRGGAPEDNPHAESFFHSLKAEVIHGITFASEKDLRTCLQEYVRYYNHERRKRTGRPLPLNAVLCRQSLRPRMLKRSLWLLAQIVALVVNVSLLLLFGWSAFNPRGVFGAVDKSIDFLALAFATFPMVNLAAIFIRWMRDNNLSPFLKAVRVMNLSLVIVALVFGVASAFESTFSHLEQVATLFLLIPPTVTSLALGAPIQAAVDSAA